MSAPDGGARPKALMSWSSGKDCAYALHLVREAGELDVVGLLTTVNEAADRVAMHGVRRSLLLAQAESLGLDAHVVELPDPCSNEIYEERMGAFVRRARREGIEAVVFGDIALEDVRAYRERQLDGTGITPHFPLFGRDTRGLAREMIEAGVVATLSCVDSREIPAEWAGRRWDAALLDELPVEVDPCGERGEFHTFVSAAPGFRRTIEVDVGERVTRAPFVFTDLAPARVAE